MAQAAARYRPRPATFVAATRRGDSGDPSHVRKRAQTTRGQLMPRARESIYGRMRNFSCDSAARRCAPVEADTFPGRLRHGTAQSTIHHQVGNAVVDLSPASSGREPSQAIVARLARVLTIVATNLSLQRSIGATLPSCDPYARTARGSGSQSESLHYAA